MGFSGKQVAALRRNVEERHIRTRPSNGRDLSYLEGWYVISQANRIFGFDGWSRETLEAKCVLSRENRGAFLAAYTAKVRITVLAEGTQVIREGHGTGEGRGASPGEAHDTALKAAETDATKRALVTFGKPFGLELYRSDLSIGARDRSGSRRNGEAKAAHPAPLQPSHLYASATYVSPEEVPSLGGEGHRPALEPTTPVNGTGIPALDSAAPLPPRQPELPRFQNAKPHPDDGTPIPRPSTHFGLQTYLATREERGALIEEARREALTTQQQNESKGTGQHHTAVSTHASGEAQANTSTTHTRRNAGIDKSVLALSEPKRLRDKNHLKYVASHPCLICGRQPADPHHLRFAQLRAIGMKVSDEFTVPLCRSHHRNLHQAGHELRWWEDFRIEPLPIARKLWEETHPGAADPRRRA
jgi:Rad52/22 family double-strand break repair protein